MRTDALDRFGTKLELRYTRSEIEQMMISAGLIEIIFKFLPYWCSWNKKIKNVWHKWFY